ncbi:hypothetical protein B0T10DRAFT_549888, partial [Thelonectria olida]
VAPALAAFQNSHTAADLDTLRSGLLAYAQDVRAQSDSIASNEKPVVKGYLKAHQDTIAEAVKKISQIGVSKAKQLVDPCHLRRHPLFSFLSNKVSVSLVTIQVPTYRALLCLSNPYIPSLRRGHSAV